jgi:ADP-heptose:LPS heptosyltransferase
MWKTYLDQIAPGKKRVGIAWTGGSWNTGRNRRSVPFEALRDIFAARPDVAFVNLEYEDRREFLLLAEHVVHNPHWATHTQADYDDTAALVAELDLVIAPTTSVVDLAGALGKPVWVMCDAHPQWRYSRAAGEDKMYVYESARVFRQSPGEYWRHVTTRVGEALAKHWAQGRAV